jgi:ubiquinone/menaquinone biosynthesis C-methylase UbiE
MTHMPETNDSLPDVKAILAEYEESAALSEEFQKVKWSSECSMLSRFELAMAKLPFANAATWLDVGCGTGAFQMLVRQRHRHIRCTGMDLSPSLIHYAKKCSRSSDCSFIVSDFMAFSPPDDRAATFDLITCIGVLQRTNFSEKEFFHRASRLLSFGGYLFLDTKNIRWREFTSGKLKPETHLRWFCVRELLAEAEKCEMRVVESAGFDPCNGRIVPEDASNDIYLIAIKL